MAVNKVIDIMERVDAYAKENSNGDNPSWMYQEQLAKVMKKFADKEGTAFHAFVIEIEDDEGNLEKKIYMTNAMISDLTGIEVNALKEHYRGKDKKSELEEEEGLLELTGSILKSEIIIAAVLERGYNLSECYIPAKFGKSGRLNTIIFKDGKEYTLNNNSQNILSLKSVMKLMLMMTNTEIAKEFRNFVIDNLVLGETAQEAADEYFEQLFDKDNIILYSNNTEKLLELLDISYKYDIMKGVILQSVDPMKDKLKRIDGFKKEFKKDIVKYESQISKYKEEDEDIFFEQINALENKIEETNRIIIALDTLAKTLLLRLNIIAKTVRKLSSESNLHFFSQC